MPIYEYVCNACGYDFERLQSFSEAPLTTCPECEGAVRRVISPAGVIFKGSGWYITDNRRKLSDKRPAAGASGAKGETASEAATTPSETSTGSDASPPATPPAATPAPSGT